MQEMKLSCVLPNGGYFIAEPESIGATDAEAVEVHAQRLDQDRTHQIAVNMHNAIDMLREAEPAGTA